MCTERTVSNGITYQFIRYVPYVTKDNITQQPDLFKKHQDYLTVLGSSASLITEAIFGEAEGEIFVVNGEITNEVIENDPAVQQGLLVAEVKKLWIAKGAFCEK